MSDKKNKSEKMLEVWLLNPGILLRDFYERFYFLSAKKQNAKGKEIIADIK